MQYPIIPIYNSFFASAFSVPAAVPVSAFSPPAFIGTADFFCCPCPVFDTITKPTTATIASLTSRIILAHAIPHTCMLIDPSGARGHESSHSP